MTILELLTEFLRIADDSRKDKEAVPFLDSQSRLNPKIQLSKFDLIAFMFHVELLNTLHGVSQGVKLTQSLRRNDESDFERIWTLKYSTEEGYEFISKIIGISSSYIIALVKVDEDLENLHQLTVTRGDLAHIGMTVRANDVPDRIARSAVVMEKLSKFISVYFTGEHDSQAVDIPRKKPLQDERIYPSQLLERAYDASEERNFPLRGTGGYGPPVPRMFEPSIGQDIGENFLIGPNNPIFHPKEGSQGPQMGPRRPPNLGPHGPRFDPFGPPPSSGFDVGDFSKPDNDHMRPPGMDHMYM